MIICTKKRSLEDAKAYVDYVISTIRTKELFHSIDMKMTHAWEFLLWCDPSNYGGIKCQQPKENSESNTMELDMDYVDQEADEDEDGPEIEMNWNLAKYLPESGACQKNFNTVVAGKKNKCKKINLYYFLYSRDQVDLKNIGFHVI